MTLNAFKVFVFSIGGLAKGNIIVKEMVKTTLIELLFTEEFLKVDTMFASN